MATIDDVIKEISVTRQQALDWIYAHIDQPKTIFQVAFENGITTSMLSDLTGFSNDLINDYFAIQGFDTGLLEEVGILFNSELGSLAHLVEFNDNGGALSTASLRDTVKVSFEDEPATYDAFFESVFDYQESDGIYSSDELGVAHLGNITASDENIESIFYGTLINIFQQFDAAEYQQIIESPGNQALLFEALSDTPAAPLWSDVELAKQVASYATDLINEFWDDITPVGILDHSFLGEAMADF
ncbi:MAG: hypothetical protein KF888_07870 [Nitrosomonas sp.]|nr:hypothetical protein [Nitrosomonas sp.]